MKRILILLILIIFVVSCTPVDSENLIDEELTDQEMIDNVLIDDKMMEITDEMKELISTAKYDYVGTLKDVTDGNAQGTIKSVFTEGKYLLKVDLKFLPDPEGTDFYEGWIVRKGLKFSVISTGRAIKAGDNEYINNYVSEVDLTDHKTYVLTLEPDDGDPAPAGHVLEGKLEETIG